MQGLITNQNRWGGVKQTIAISSRFVSKKSASFICQNNVLQNKCLANLILVDHFWIFGWLLLFYPTGNLIVFVGERFTIALFFSSLKPWSSCFFRDIKWVRGSHCNFKKSIFAVELELKVKETIDSYANTNTVLSHTLFSRANGLVWSCLLNILQTCLGGLPFLKTHGLREHSCVQVRTLSESTSIQFALTTLPRNLILGTRKVHLSMLSVRPASLRRSNTFCNL